MASDVTTLPYPGFPTDLQPQFMTLLTMCRGQSVVTETVFESRMRHGTPLTAPATPTGPVVVLSQYVCGCHNMCGCHSMCGCH